jgi:hypothetical protein
LSHADVSKGQQPCYQITSLKVRVEAYDGIALRVVAQLKVERLCHPLQDKRHGCVTRDEMDPGSTIASGDSDVLGRRYWSRQEQNRAKPDTEGRIHEETTDAASAPRRRTQLSLPVLFVVAAIIVLVALWFVLKPQYSELLEPMSAMTVGVNARGNESQPAF